MEAFKELSFVAFVFVHQSHSPLCSIFRKTKSTKNTIKTIPTYYFTFTKRKIPPTIICIPSLSLRVSSCLTFLHKLLGCLKHREHIFLERLKVSV